MNARGAVLLALLACAGAGIQYRKVSCRSREELDVVDDSLCDAAFKPSTNQTCNMRNCSATWVLGPWSACSRPCGEGGSRSRQVQCQKIITNGETFSYPSIVDDQECFDVLGEKPPLYQECNKNASCPTWFTGPWKPCDKLCGEGKQTRQVVCHQKNNGRVEVLPESECADEKPAVQQHCMIHPCEGVDWILSDWTGCVNCLSPVATREVECATKDRVVVDRKFCENHPLPETQKPCNASELPPCQVQWYATQWSNCSVECGEGVKTRRVFCGQLDGASVVTVDDKKCENETKYNDTTPCEIPKEKCPAKWFAGPWSECTAECGVGEQFRHVMCLSGGKEATVCDPDNILFTVRSCNTDPCDEAPWDPWGFVIPGEKAAKSVKSTFGCCPDKKTPAAGPFDEGCPNPKTCNETQFGCCPDGVSPAGGARGRGCPSANCSATLFGCCRSDNSTPAEGNDQEGCPPPPPACKSSKYGCCKDEKTEATGAKKKGCPETATEAPCKKAKFGCCYDNKTESTGPDGQGCPCNAIKFGCCPDNITPAGSADKADCMTSCNTSAHGCCPDGETPAHGPDGEGCCLTQRFGCCPDNYKPAEGPHLQGCECQFSRFGCCPDNVTTARGPDREGCSCHHSPHGCCPDQHTTASGDNFEGCGCHTYQFGCCPDGVTVAKGPNLQGCDCRQSPHGCCGDGETAAAGPDRAGCDCAASNYGCCPDGLAEAQGIKFVGCADAPENKQASCSLPNDRGSCDTYSMRWFYDMKYGGCSRFWYSGCGGNGNRFTTKQECEDVCVQVNSTEACQLPMVHGPCTGWHPRWSFAAELGRCELFYWSGCGGNANNFKSSELCEAQCQPDKTKDLCQLPIERGSCAGSFSRWGFAASAGRCEQFAWGGCGGNPNRFTSEAACMLRCRPPGQLVTTWLVTSSGVSANGINNGAAELNLLIETECTQPQAAGNCSDKQPAWSFSATENRCVPFYYSGCAGNDNRFGDERSCAQACPSAFGSGSSRAYLGGAAAPALVGHARGRPTYRRYNYMIPHIQSK